MMLSPHGASFPCHKTVEYDEEGDGRATFDTEHCAGAYIFAEKNGNATQMMRIAERLGLYDHRKLKNKDAVFDTMSEMLKANRLR